MTKQKTLHDAFYETLKDVYYAEKQSVKALKKSAKAAEHAELRQAFETHARGERPAGGAPDAGLRDHRQARPGEDLRSDAGDRLEMEEDLEDFAETPAADAVLAACAQAVEHYEIARYGTLKTWAGQLGYADAAKLLDETLQEEKKTDARLSEIAVSINAAGTRGRHGGVEGQGLEEGRLITGRAGRAGAPSLAGRWRFRGIRRRSLRCAGRAPGQIGRVRGGSPARGATGLTGTASRILVHRVPVIRDRASETGASETRARFTAPG